MLSILALFVAQITTQLPDTVVVETRQPVAVADTSPSVSRVQASDATEAGLISIAQAVNSLPGVFAPEQQGEGTVASLFIRGTNSDQSEVLLDGRRLQPGFSGTYEISRYRILGLDSLEVMRGPSSILYGANALGGVINLRLIDPLAAKPSDTLIVEAGSYGRLFAGVQAITNNAQANTSATNGTSVGLTTSHDDGWRPNSYRDATTALAKTVWQLSPNLTADVIGTVDLAKEGLPGQATPTQLANLNDWEKDTGWMISPGLHYNNGPLSAHVFWSHGGSNVTSYTNDTNIYGTSLYLMGYQLERDEITAWADWKACRQLTVELGATYEHTHYNQVDFLGTSTNWTDTIEGVGVWSRLNWHVTDKDEVVVGVRQEQFNQFASKTTGEFDYRHKLTSELLFHVKVASAYRAPSANDLAYGTSGNQPLKPESNLGEEIGLRYESALPNAFSWTLVAFENQLTNLIDYNPADNYKTFNIGKARTRGIELGSEIRPLKGLRCFGSATYLETEALTDYQSIVLAGQSLLRRPKWDLNAGIELIPNDDWTVGLSANYLADRADYDFDNGVRVNLPDAVYLRAWVRRVIDERSEISLRLENLTNETTPPTAYGYAAQPRSVYLAYTRKF
jgi:vitamin B12 transporter